MLNILDYFLNKNDCINLLIQNICQKNFPKESDKFQLDWMGNYLLLSLTGYALILQSVDTKHFSKKIPLNNLQSIFKF